MFFFSSRRRHTRYWRDWSSDVCSSDLEVLRVHVGQREGDEPCPVLLWTVYGDALDPREPAIRVLAEPPLVLPYVVHPKLFQVVHGGAQAHGLRDVHRPGLESVGQIVPGGVLEMDLPDHLASADKGIHLLQHLR